MQTAGHAAAGPDRWAVFARWLPAADGSRRLLQNQYVHIRGNTIEAVSPDRPDAHVDVVRERDALVIPGFVNLHNHCINGSMFKCLRDDTPFPEPVINRLIYDLLQPMSEVAQTALDRNDVVALTTLGLLDVLKGGSTTILDQWNIRQESWFEAAAATGVRGYAAPSVMSVTDVQVGAGEVTYTFGADEAAMMAELARLHRIHDGSEDGRIRVIMSGHAPDTCSPELLAALRAEADALGCPVTIHLSQTEDEVRIVQGRFGKTPVELLDSVGLLGRDLIAAHCVHLTERDLELLRGSGTTVVNCPVSFIWGGESVPFSRTAARGIRTCFGTDSHGLAFLNEARLAGWLSKLHDRRPDSASAYDILDAGTRQAADALGRPDLGRIAPGCRADLLVVPLDRTQFQPVWDPVKSLVWKSHGCDHHLVAVDGRIVVREGRSTLVDERELIGTVAEAAGRFWAIAERQGRMDAIRTTRAALV